MQISRRNGLSFCEKDLAIYGVTKMIWKRHSL